MDQYDLFGEDGSGMLESLPELGSVHLDPAVTADRNAPTAYSQPVYSQESSLQKLATFGTSSSTFSHMDPNTQQSLYAQNYGTAGEGRPPMGPPGGAYGHTRQVPRPPAAPPGANQYPYQATADSMYSMSDIQVGTMSDPSAMQAGWGQHAAAYPGMHRYPQMSQYRQQPMGGYPHQQEQKQQFPSSQHPMMQQPHQTPYQIPQRHAPHGYPQASTYPSTAPNQSYGGYVHQRMPHHHQYPQTHHQMDLQNQQYSQIGHSQPLPHPAGHAAPTSGHMGQAHPVAHPPVPSQQPPPSQNPMTHPSGIINYNQSHQPVQPMQRPMDIQPSAQQQFTSKHTGPTGNSSPQYRAPFPQLSPQMSPRPQISPRPQAPQVSPRPVMSPAKPNMSPHQQHSQMQQTNLSPRPATSLTPKSTVSGTMPPYSQQSTLQALEQMVMPPSSTSITDYPSYQPRNSLGPPPGTQHPLSPSMSSVIRNQISDQWPPPHSPRQPQSHMTSLNGTMSMIDHVSPNQSIPAAQTLISTQLTTTSNTPLSNNSSTMFESEDLRLEKPKSVCDKLEDNMMSSAGKDRDDMIPQTSQSMPVTPRHDFTSVQSPTTSIPDKLPSSTTHTEPNISVFSQSTSSHPPTPTPTSTTDDNITNIQETSLPSHTDSLTHMDELSNASSTSNQQTPSQSNRSHNSTDFNRVSSMTSYQSQPEISKGGGKGDDLNPSNVFMYNQENSLSQESLPESNKSESSIIQSPRLQSPNFHNQTSGPPNLENPENKSGFLNQSISNSPSSPSQSHSLSNQNTSQPSSHIPISRSLSSEQLSVSNSVPNVSQHMPPTKNIECQNSNPTPVAAEQHSISNIISSMINTSNQSVDGGLPMASTNLVSAGNVPSSSASNNQINPSAPPVSTQNTQPISGSNQGSLMSLNAQPAMSNIQNQSTIIPPNVSISNTMINMHNQVPSNANIANIYDQSSHMLGPSGMGLPRQMPPGIPHVPMPGMTHPGMSMMPGMGHIPNMGMMAGQDMPGYQPPISHQQERAALQQQLQELYCMPQASDHQEKIMNLQEKLNILSQHEATEQCNGGSQCILQSPMFTSPMIDSPQVTSTTGRGRGKGTNKPRKPRAKKGEKVIISSNAEISQSVMTNPTLTQPQQLPVSEDFVTPGAGLNIPSSDMSEFTELAMEQVTEEKKKGRKPREPKKPKEPKIPKEPKSPKEPKIPKERKKRESKDSQEPTRVKRKYVRKKKPVDGSEESAAEDSFNKSADSSQNVFNMSDKHSSEEAEAMPEKNTNEPFSSCRTENFSEKVDNDDCEMQADSQTPADGPAVPESGDENKKDEYTFDESQIDEEIGEMPKRNKKPRGAPKRVISSKTRSKPGPKRGRRKGTQPESDGEGEDLITTPPPSPPEDDNSNKRRSARNTQRKKYIDDVMLRFSDDDTPPVPRSRKPPVPEKPILPITTTTTVAPQPASSSASTNETVDEDGKELPTATADAAKGMNYVYVNTTDEDSMVVQHVLASRMSKREIKIEEVQKIEDPVDVEGETEKFSENENESTGKIQSLPHTLGSDKNKLDENKQTNKVQIVEVEEYFVKYRNFSYLHCEWKTEDELFKGDKRIANKIKRFKQKQAQMLNIFEALDEEPFNPDYVEVDRVLDVSEHVDPSTGETVRHYLVKWRSLQYEDCTWELEEDVDPIKIEQYEKFTKVPPKEKWKSKKKPNPESWSKLEISPIYKGGNILREYQLEGLNWLLFSWYNGLNCILADEMGLGKTIQSLTFIHAVWEHGIRGPFLVIAPLSTIPNWQREIESWTDMNVIVYHGSATSRNMIQEYEMYYKNEKGVHINDTTKFNILITTFEIIVTDFADLKGFNWRLCVIDEAHRLKNRNCKLLEGLRQLTLEHRVLLSGTPLQNNVNELFSLLNFLEPTQFSNSEAFVKEFGSLKTEQEVQKLQCLLKPMMLRRLKDDVEKSLAPKEETVVEVELTNIQKKYYRGILERNFSFLTKGTTYANIPNLMNTMMELRKCCIHPYLLNGAEDQIQYDYKQQNGEDADAYYKALIHSSGKMVLIDKLLAKLKANGHRVLVFSQMVKCLDILEDYLMYRKYPYERIDGRIRGNLRQAAIDRFSKPDSDRFVFLLCTKAGGLGINLTAADTVIIYDSDWNPQNDLQAQARCHRIGQQKMVKIYRLLCRNTYEREMFDKASLKLGLDKAILQSMNTTQGDKGSGHRQLSKKEIEDLLKKGAYGALLDEENDGDKFCEEDIDVILARRTQVITMESEKGSTFSKASFASSASRSDIDLDDPDFWNKWAKKAEIDTTEKDETEDLLISEPRRRTQIKRYGHDEGALDMSELESSSDSDPENDPSGLRSSRRNKLKKKKLRGDDYIPRDGEKGEMVYGSWSRRECFMVERGLLTFGWGRWQEILLNSQLRKGWREQDIEDCARVILLYCLRFYRGDEKIRNFIWDLIAPSESGEQKISRNHQGLKDPVPRGIRNKHKKKPSKDTRHAALTDPNHWSKNEKYDGDIFLENNYKKHLGRHANKVLLRVRMLYYIKHEIIGDLVQHITDGVQASALPIYPPVTEQLPAPWWDSEFDKSLLIGTWKHGYENYTAMRQDPALCFLSRCGPPTDREIQQASTNMQPPTPTQTPLNEDDIDDEDTNEESSLKSKNRDAFELNSEAAEPSPGPSACSESQQLEGDEMKDDTGEDKTPWPTVTDLNTRLRRVITSYQRNYRKEEQKLQASKAKQQQQQQQQSSIDTSALTSPLAALAQVSQQFDSRDAASLGLQGWDLQQLALYLLKMERQGKQALEQAIKDNNSKEREHQCISKRWTKREEADFFRITSSYGVIYNRKTKKYDWTKFKQLAKLEKKSDDDLTDYYKHFVMMCKKQTGINMDDCSYDTTIEHINEEKARRTLERLELLSRIREEILPHPKLDDRLKVCLTSADMPEWWIPGKHDKELLIGVGKYGLGRTDHYLLNDPALSFHEILKNKVNSDSQDAKGAIKLESHEDILKFDKDEILVKLEKGEGTLKIEKVIHKKETIDDKKMASMEDKGELSTEEKLTDQNEELLLKKEEPKPTVDEKETLKSSQDQNNTKENEEAEFKVKDEENKVKQEIEEKTESKKTEIKVEEEMSANDLCSKQAAELKAMFPDLEVIQPLSRLSQVDTFVLNDRPSPAGVLDFSETTVAQLFNKAVKWPKEYAIQVRLQHIIYAVETKEWPASKAFSAYATGIGNEFDIPIHELPNEPPKRETSTPDIDISLTKKSDKRKRHIAIDVETERAKLHALLNNSHGSTSITSKSPWDEDSEDSRRSTPQGALQPPPAHQHRASTINIGIGGMPFDFSNKYQPPLTPKTIGQTTVIPGTSSTLTPIDLSSSIPKTDKLLIDVQNEVQDFSLKKPSMSSGSNNSTISPAGKIGNKLDDTLSKLMKRKNCPEPEPLVGKEKKRRKLDEIVLGLSAAKEQSLYPEATKKPPVTPSVTVTPTTAPVSTSHSPTQKPFTITVTSVPSVAQPTSRSNAMPNILPTLSSKDSFSSFLAQAEQQNLMLKKQQQQHRKSYEAMIADIGSKVNTYSHEAKVNKWLAEQNVALAEQPLNADYLTRRRRPRVDPTLLDWKKLTGDENVSVIHRVTGKKLTGPKAPTLKRLGQWLMENPMYDIDPKWSELVKERGNLGNDLHKRLPAQNVSNMSGVMGSSKSKTNSSSSSGRPPLLSSPTGSTSSVSSANVTTSLPSSMSFPSLTGTGLAGLNTNLLSGLSGLGQFDPKTNPLLMPFAGLPMGSMGGLGNLSNMNLFANLAGLGLPGLGGMDPAMLASAAAAATSSSKNSNSKSSSTATSSRSDKPQEAHTSSKSHSSNTSNIPTTSPFPFFFPNPSLLYTPLGLGGLNPFTLQPGMSAYDSLGLLNGNINPTSSPNSGSKMKSSSSTSSRPSSVVTTTNAVSSPTSSSAIKQSSRSLNKDPQMSQLLLPPDTQILEGMPKLMDSGMKIGKSERKDDKHKSLDRFKGMLSSDLMHMPKDKRTGALPGFADFTKLLEAQVSHSARKSQEQQMKEALEQFNKTNAELVAKALAEEQARLNIPISKRQRDSNESPVPLEKCSSEEEQPIAKKPKTQAIERYPAPTDVVERHPTPQPVVQTQPPLQQSPALISHEGEGVDIETLLPSSVVTSASVTPEKAQPSQIENTQESPEEAEPTNDVAQQIEAPPVTQNPKDENPKAAVSSEDTESPPKKNIKRRGKRKSGEIPLDPEAVMEKKNLRSSASRSAAAAAARQQREAESAQKESENTS